MTVTIGIFESEETILEAAKQVKEQGYEAESVRIAVKNAEAAPILSAQSDIPVEELHGIYESRERYGEAPRGGIVAAPLSTTGSYTGIGTFGQGAVVGDLTGKDSPDMQAVLRDIGIPDKHAEECERALESGQLLLIAEGELSASTNDMIYRAGALAIIH
jgi:hypothetical protein